MLADIREFLHTFHIAQETLSAEKTPTLPLAVPAYETLIAVLQLLRIKLRNVAHGITASICKLRKYTAKARKTKIYSLAMGKQIC